MRIDKGRISGSQLMLSIACFIQASSLLSSYLMALTFQDSWFPLVIGTVFCVGMIWVYRELMLTFPEQHFLQMLDTVYGKGLGRALGALYLWHLATLTSLNLTDMSELSKVSIMGEMPLFVLGLMCIAVCAYAVRNGVRSVVWASALFAFITFAVLILTILLTANQMDFQNFLPMLQLPAGKYIQGVHIISTIPLGEIAVIMMLNPNVKLTRKNSKKYLFGGFLLGAAGLLIPVVRDVAVLGDTAALFAQPSLITLRMVRLGEALSRMEILFIIILVMLLFFKITMLYYITVVALSHLFGVQDQRRLVWVTGAFALVYGLTLFPDPVVHAESAQRATPVIWTFFEILVPLLTLALAKRKKRPAASAQKEA